MNAQGVLCETAVLVGEGWCSGADARDRAGAAVGALDPTATSWSLPGALAVVAGMPGVDLDTLAVALTAVAGLAADQALFRFTRNNLVNGLLVSIGLIAIMEATALLIWTSTPKDMHYVLPGVVQAFGIVVPKIKLVVFGILVLVILATYAALTRTWVGRAAFAYAQNREAAELMGVRTKLLQSGVVVYSTALAGLGGALYASLYSLEPTMGSAYILKAVEAAILAGIGSVLGSLFGGIILGVTEGTGSIFLPIAFRDAYGLLFLIAILLFKPAGLFASKR